MKYTTGTSLFHTCRRIILTANNVLGTFPKRAFFTVSVTLADFRPDKIRLYREIEAKIMEIKVIEINAPLN